jgi:hypothetical protein
VTTWCTRKGWGRRTAVHEQLISRAVTASRVRYYGVQHAGGDELSSDTKGKHTIQASKAGWPTHQDCHWLCCGCIVCAQRTVRMVSNCSFTQAHMVYSTGFCTGLALQTCQFVHVHEACPGSSMLRLQEQSARWLSAYRGIDVRTSQKERKVSTVSLHVQRLPTKRAVQLS